MSDVVRAVGYVGGRQQLQWSGDPVQAQCYLWGGGGGGGGQYLFVDTNIFPGGNGTGGGWSEITFALSAGDVIEIVVGQGGAPGLRGRFSPFFASGGLGGQSLTFDLFDSRNAVGAIAQTNGAWSPFMNTHAVWDAGDNTYNYSQTVNFPYTGYYTFTYAVDNSVTVTLDGTTIISFAGFQDNPAVNSAIFVTAGNHVLSWTAVNAGGPRGIALTIAASFCGGNGGSAGGDISGGAGGGGGATALYLNNTLIAVASGGGGGGGSGRFNNAPFGPDAPGPNGVALDGVFAGQNGQTTFTASGGAGGGGGGYAGGQGGSINFGNNGDGGSPGRGLGLNILSPFNTSAAGSNNQYYAGGSRGGTGGVTEFSTGRYTPATAGQNGYAVFVFQSPGVFVRDADTWKPVQDIYLRQNNVWQRVDNSYIRNDGVWIQTRGANPPVFASISGNWGRGPRSNSSA